MDLGGEHAPIEIPPAVFHFLTILGAALIGHVVISLISRLHSRAFARSLLYDIFLFVLLYAVFLGSVPLSQELRFMLVALASVAIGATAFLFAVAGVIDNRITNISYSYSEVRHETLRRFQDP
jgi:hypothetical protein